MPCLCLLKWQTCLSYLYLSLGWTLTNHLGGAFKCTSFYHPFNSPGPLGLMDWKKKSVCQVHGDPQYKRQIPSDDSCDLEWSVHLATGKMFLFPFVKKSKNPKYQQNQSQGIAFSLAGRSETNYLYRWKGPWRAGQELGHPRSRSNGLWDSHKEPIILHW